VTVTPLIPPEHTLPIIQGALGCLRAVPGDPEQVQLDTLAAIAELVAGAAVDINTLPGMSATELADAVTDLTLRRVAVSLLVTMELIIHPVPSELDSSVRAYARALGIDTPMLRAAHQFAENHIALMYHDIERQSWYTKETARRIARGHLFEILRSKLASLGGPGDPVIAARWRALESCPDGSWGRAVADFYHQHGFTYPGEKGSIREVGAEHDWVHVLADYPPDPEGEIDVFAFIAASMRNPEGFAMLASTLGLFQNGSLRHIAGEYVSIARADTLSDPDAAWRFADAMRRGFATTVDVLAGIDHFAYRNTPLEDARDRFSVAVKEVSGPSSAR
jgi:hypothetical protein